MKPHPALPVALHVLLVLLHVQYHHVVGATFTCLQAVPRQYKALVLQHYVCCASACSATDNLEL